MSMNATVREVPGGSGGPLSAVVDCGRWLAVQPTPSCPGIDVLAHQVLDAAGRGVRIALLDAPADLGHPDLASAAIESWPGVHGLGLHQPTAHGTACASLLVGQGVAQIRGVAAESDLLIAPVMRADGSISDELVARGLAWAVARGADVVVLPFGRRRLGRRVAVRVRHAVVSGVRVVAAAGSLGPDLMTFPGSISGVLAVTGHDGTGRCPECSIRADLAAPGRDVPAAGPYGIVRMQGSAPAAVLAAGALAVRLSAAAEAGDGGREVGQGNRLVKA